MGALQPLHLVLILLIVLIIFGVGRLADVGGAVGKSVRDFRETVDSKSSGGTTAASTSSTGAGYCSKCGNALTPGARFCPKCGAPV